MADLRERVEAELANIEACVNQLPSGVDLAVSEGLLSKTTVVALDEYRAFRHFLAHAYAVNLRANLLQPLVANAEIVLSAFRSDINNAVNRISGA